MPELASLPVTVPVHKPVPDSTPVPVSVTKPAKFQSPQLSHSPRLCMMPCPCQSPQSCRTCVHDYSGARFHVCLGLLCLSFCLSSCLSQKPELVLLVLSQSPQVWGHQVLCDLRCSRVALLRGFLSGNFPFAVRAESLPYVVQLQSTSGLRHYGVCLIGHTWHTMAYQAIFLQDLLMHCLVARH